MMKNLLAIILCFLIFFSLFQFISAVGPQAPYYCNIRSLDRVKNITGLGTKCQTPCRFDYPDLECATCCLVSTLVNVTDWIFIFLMAIVIIFVLFGAFYILTAGGDTEKVSKGRNFIIYAAVGLLIALLARAVPAIVMTIGGF